MDFKTGNPEYVNEFQIQMYALPILREIDSQPVELAYAFLKTGTMRKSSITRAEATHLIKNIMEQIRSIEADEEFPAQPNQACHYCGVRNICDYSPWGQ